MTLRDILQKKKDPQGYAERRAHEILRELEDILATIQPRIDAQLTEVDAYTATKKKEISQLATEFAEVRNQIYREVEPRIREMRGLISDAESRLDTKTTSFIEKQSYLLSSIESKIEQVKLMKGPKGDPGESIQGPPGAKGEDGSPDTGIQIAEKVNREKESIAMSTIKGLTQTIEELKRAIRQKQKGGGGGGMGDVQEETFSISSATTSVQVSSTIGLRGYAIMGVYYQGQFLARGIGYTVGGDRRTITLLFTPQDSTNIDIVYVRG